MEAGCTPPQDVEVAEPEAEVGVEEGLETEKADLELEAGLELEAEPAMEAELETEETEPAMEVAAGGPQAPPGDSSDGADRDRDRAGHRVRRFRDLALSLS